MYKSVNDMLGDIVKVTPSSKMVGDMAIFMVQRELTPENIVEKGRQLDYPDSVVSYFKGMMGQPEGGFPEDLQKIVLKGEEPIRVRPGELLEDHDFEKDRKYLKEKYDFEASDKDLIASALYPKVFEEYLKYRKEKGDFSHMDSAIFFHGLNEGQTGEVELEEGKILIVTLVEIGKLDEKGYRTLTFEVNGNRREIKVFDQTAQVQVQDDFVQMADPDNDHEIGASIPGSVVKLLVKEGDRVEKNQALMVVEAMKMETNLVSNTSGVIDTIIVKEGDMVESGQLLITLKKD